MVPQFEGACTLCRPANPSEMLDDERSTFILDIPAGAEGIVRMGDIKPNRETK